MAKKSTKQKFTISFGGWYQRTTLHLTEVYDLFARGFSKLPLPDSKLTDLQQCLSFKSVKREMGYLEFVHAFTADGIEVKYYEDGLYVFSIESSDIVSAHQRLKDFYQNCFAPAIAYIFSLGAPTPKVLAEIKTDNPVAVFANSQSFSPDYIDKKGLGPVYSQIISPNHSVFKTPKYIFIAAKGDFQKSHELIETQIFFREFKDQLERYLNIHRTIWEEIQEIKERPVVKGKSISKLKEKLDIHQKTINLINSRLNQMKTYVKTRASIASSLKITDDLNSIFQYKFETLSNTHVYIKDLWTMTKKYLNNAIRVISDVQDQSTDKTIESLRLITTIGVLSGIFGYFSMEKFPTPTYVGIVYFVALVAGTWLINRIVSFVYKNIKYRLEFTKNKT